MFPSCPHPLHTLSPLSPVCTLGWQSIRPRFNMTNGAEFQFRSSTPTNPTQLHFSISSRICCFACCSCKFPLKDELKIGTRTAFISWLFFSLFSPVRFPVQNHVRRLAEQKVNARTDGAILDYHSGLTCNLDFSVVIFLWRNTHKHDKLVGYTENKTVILILKYPLKYISKGVFIELNI